MHCSIEFDSDGLRGEEEKNTGLLFRATLWVIINADLIVEDVVAVELKAI